MKRECSEKTYQGMIFGCKMQRQQGIGAGMKRFHMPGFAFYVDGILIFFAWAEVQCHSKNEEHLEKVSNLLSCYAA
jgi:hypothetical protein